jgi:class 3 adenylate cyclase/tetratricopeptide (TPR) repeat protein
LLAFGAGARFHRELVVAESIELATILLTDLVGSTRLAMSVGPVRADQLRDEHFALLRQAIESAGGREVKNTGDGLMVAFRSASAAVRCAVAMQQLFERRYRRSEQQLHVRIGLGAGESTVQDSDYFGVPSIEAARLCDQAPSDGILASPAVRMLASRVDGLAFESMGEVELKGFDGPVETFSVPWIPLGEESRSLGRWSLPAELRSVPPISYVGYETERALIEQSWSEARAGARRVVLLGGEPGIGKTRLASYAALGANVDGSAVVWGSCSEELAVPYEPWIEVCSQLVERAPEGLLSGYVEDHGGELVRLARNLARRVPGLPAPQSSDPETERFLLFSAVAGLVGDFSQVAPVCLVLDDLHWADAQSVALFKHLVRTLEPSTVQLIATYRDSDLGRDHPLTAVLADLRKVDGVQRIGLRGLDADAVAQMLAAAAGHELEQEGLALAGQIASESDGNPFFVGEILRSLIESGTLQFDELAGRWRIDRSAPLGLPESIREVIGRRVDRLGVDARELLAAAAVVGRSFEIELLAEVGELGEKRLLDQLESAVAASVLEESTERAGEFRFTHALISQTLYEDLGATRRARLHRRIAETLEAQLGGDPGARVGELANHWAKATTVVDLEKAVRYARMAGERALAELAPGEAVGWFGRALELLGDRAEPATRCDLLIGLGEAQRLNGDTGYRETLLDAARLASELHDGERAARAALANSRGRVPSAFFQVDQERVEAAIERALELDDDLGRRAMLLSLQAIELVYRPDHRRRRTLAEQALALAREFGDPRTTARVLTDYFFIYYAPDGLERRLEHLDELRASVQAAGDPAVEFWAANAEMCALVEAGELERAEKPAERMSAIAERLGDPTMRWLAALVARAGMALLRGDLAEVERCAKQGLQIGSDAGQPDAYGFYAGQLGVVRLVQGRVSDVLALEKIVRAQPLVATWKAALAWSLCWLGRGGEAAAIVAEAAADRFEHVPWDWQRTSVLAMYADAAAQAGVTDAAEILYELIEPWADQVAWTGSNTYGHARTYLGLLAATLGWDERADEHFKLACDLQEQAGMVLWAARAHLGWAEALAARGEGERAREAAGRALDLAREHGYGLFERRVAALVATQSAAGA